MRYGITRKNIKKDEEWLEELRAEADDVKQEDIMIAKAMVKQQCKRIPNWKAPQPDGVEGF